MNHQIKFSFDKVKKQIESINKELDEIKKEMKKEERLTCKHNWKVIDRFDGMKQSIFKNKSIKSINFSLMCKKCGDICQREIFLPYNAISINQKKEFDILINKALENSEKQFKKINESKDLNT